VERGRTGKKKHRRKSNKDRDTGREDETRRTIRRERQRTHMGKLVETRKLINKGGGETLTLSFNSRKSRKKIARRKSQEETAARKKKHHRA
jgi:hypothetical protein